MYWLLAPFLLPITTGQHYLSNMLKITITTTYSIKWQFKDEPDYVITACRKVVNRKRGTVLKQVKSGGSIGYYIKGIFVNKNEINSKVKLIENKPTPF
jgi:hypothetical protein